MWLLHKRQSQFHISDFHVTEFSEVTVYLFNDCSDTDGYRIHFVVARLFRQTNIPRFHPLFVLRVCVCVCVFVFYVCEKSGRSHPVLWTQIKMTTITSANHIMTVPLIGQAFTCTRSIDTSALSCNLLFAESLSYMMYWHRRFECESCASVGRIITIAVFVGLFDSSKRIFYYYFGVVLFC